MLKENGIPLYYQIETILRQRILSRVLKEGMQFPNEEALQKEFGVSRITVRHALASLESEGIIARKRGKGTFISMKTRLLEADKLTGSMEKLLLMAVNSSVKLLEVGMIDPPQIVKESLRIAEEKQVFRVRKIRILDGSPFSYVINYFPEEIGLKLSRAELEKKSSLSQILERSLGIYLDEAVQTIEATIAGTEEAELLSVRFGDPLLRVQRVVFDVKKKPIEHVSVLYRADRYSFTVRLKRKRLKNSTHWDTAEVASQ
jgi:GntR family transcriptional regulator